MRVTFIVVVGCLLAVAAVATTTEESAVQYYGVQRHRCLWVCARKGVHVSCGPDQVMSGMCGSGSNSDCNHDSYCPDTSYNRVAVLCCSVKVVPANRTAPTGQ